MKTVFASIFFFMDKIIHKNLNIKILDLIFFIKVLYIYIYMSKFILKSKFKRKKKKKLFSNAKYCNCYYVEY